MTDTTDTTYSIAEAELRQFIERAEQLASEKRDIAEQEKELFAEAVSRGYDKKAMKRVIALRKIEKAKLAEQEAIEQLYRDAVGV
jgi:uncharacterized protein (UPF0335 family)